MLRLPLFFPACFLLIGVVVSANTPFSKRGWFLMVWLSLIAVLLEILMAKWRKRHSDRFQTPPFYFSVILIGFFVGGWRYQSSLPDFTPQHLAYYHGQSPVRIEGVIAADPQNLEGSTRLVVSAQSIRFSGGETLPVHGKVQVQTRSFDWQFGDRVQLYGRLDTPPESEEFSYRDYLARSKIYSFMLYPVMTLLDHNQGNRFLSWLYKQRHRMHNLIQDLFPQPEGALLSGILLGIETDIAPELEVAFQKTGTAHIIAISGFNMTLLSGLFLRRFRRWLPIWWAGVTAVCVITIYTLFVGAAPAVVRAALMSALSMTGGLMGRKQAGPFTLLLTAAGMVLVNPLILWDAGFQLSVMATLGLILYADPILAWFERTLSRYVSRERVKQISAPVGEYFLFTLAAQLTIFPVLLFHFESFSLSSFLANPLILPPQPYVMTLGGVVVLIGSVFPFLGRLLSPLVWLPLVYTNQMVTALAHIPSGVLRVGQLSWWSVFLLYGLIFGITLKTKLREWLFSKWKPLFAVGLSVGAALLVWNYALFLPDRQLTIHLFGNPHQQGLYLQTPSGNEILINPGEHGNTISSQISRKKSVFDRDLDLIFIPDRRQQAYAALPLLLDRFQVRHLVWGNTVPNSALAERIKNQLHDQQIPVSVLEAGTRIDCGDGVIVEAIYLEEQAYLVRIGYGNFSFYMMEGNLSQQLLASLEPAAVVYVQEAASAVDWSSLGISLVIVPQRSEDQETGSVLGLDTVNEVEIQTDGQKMTLFKY